MRQRRLFFTVILMLAPLVSPVGAQTTGVREVTASDRSVIPLNTKLRYTTMVVLPQDEEILDVICGDRDFWVISATQNIAHVKPAKDGATTNLNLVTASGAIYSFLLTEAMTAALQDELAEVKAAIQLTHTRSEEALASFRKEYPATLAFAFGTPKYEKPFFVRSIWHDGQFTYIRSDARELPALYELRDGEPSLVNFQVQNGTYVIPKVLDRGYLALGKERFSFQQGQ